MGENELPQERIEDADEYKKIFNDEIISVNALKDEEILDRIHSLEKVIREARTRSQAANFTLNEKKKKMNREQRMALEEKDRAYKVKDVVTEVKERKAPQSKEEKMVADIMKLLKLSGEDAKKWIKENG